MERFEDKIFYSPDGCWYWIGAIDKDGYGHILSNGVNRKAHRVSFELHLGEIGHFQVLHRCDNPSCVNPDHLFLGTPFDNMQDMITKGRKNKTHRSSPKDLTGQKFWMLTAIKIVRINKYHNAVWLVRCDCGIEKEVSSTHLTSGSTVSCGCWRSFRMKVLRTQNINYTAQ